MGWAAAAPAIASAVGTVGGALIGSGSANKAGKVQDEAARRAEALEAERLAEQRRQFDVTQRMQQSQWDAMQRQQAVRRAMVAGMLKRYGVSVPDDFGAMPTAMPEGINPAASLTSAGTMLPKNAKRSLVPISSTPGIETLTPSLRAPEFGQAPEYGRMSLSDLFGLGGLASGVPDLIRKFR